LYLISKLIDLLLRFTVENSLDDVIFLLLVIFN
jgi:hypothetical protein